MFQLDTFEPMTEDKNLTKEQFHGLVLVFAAHADNIVKDVEIETITNRTSAKIFDDMSALYGKLGTVEGFKILIRNKERFYPGKEGTSELLQSMEAVFMCDDEYHPEEKKLYAAMKNIFTQLR